MHNWLILRWRLRPLPYSLKPWVSHRGNRLSEPNFISSRFFEPILSFSTISHLLLHLDIMFTLIKSPSKLRAEHIIYIITLSAQEKICRHVGLTLQLLGQLDSCQLVRSHVHVRYTETFVCHRLLHAKHTDYTMTNDWLLISQGLSAAASCCR